MNSPARARMTSLEAEFAQLAGSHRGRRTRSSEARAPERGSVRKQSVELPKELPSASSRQSMFFDRKPRCGPRKTLPISSVTDARVGDALSVVRRGRGFQRSRFHRGSPRHLRSGEPPVDRAERTWRDRRVYLEVHNEDTVPNFRELRRAAISRSTNSGLAKTILARWINGRTHPIFSTSKASSGSTASAARWLVHRGQYIRPRILLLAVSGAGWRNASEHSQI